MNNKLINRRDALKVFTSIGVSALTAKLLNRQLNLTPNLSDDHPNNFIIVLFDTLSARHMSLHGYQRKTTPNIDMFARSSNVYHRHYAPSNFTQSSTASILTGVHPWSHRSLEFFGPLLPEFNKANLFGALPPSFHNIGYTHNIHAMNILEQFRSEIQLLKPIEDLVLFRANDLEYIFENDKVMGEYATKRWLETYLAESYSLFLNPIFSTGASVIASNFNKQHRDLYPIGLSERDGYLFKIEDAIDWIIEITSKVSNPFLGYFHLLPPHETYRPRAEFLNMFAEDHFFLPEKPEHFFTEGVSEESQQTNCRLYDEYTAHVDSEFGRLIKKLEENGTLDNTYIILTSDHGQLFERGIHGHHQPVLYESVIHTPLVIHTPGQIEGTNIYSVTSAVDLVPTILHLAREPVGDNFEGQVLPGLGGEQGSQRVVFSTHARRNAKISPLNKVTFAAIQWPWKLIEYRGYDGLADFDELFDLENDPEELINLANEKPSIVSILKEELRKNQQRAEEKSLRT